MSTSWFGRALSACAALVGATVITGCIAVGGNEHYTKPTLGRQLMDLKTARDTGAVNPDEYERAKDDLLHGRVANARAN